jgi:hypothetical protein
VYIAITSCWHFQGHRLDVYTHWLTQALTLMQQHKVEAILHCGDVFHYGRVGNSDAPSSSVVDAVRSAVEAAQIPMFMAEGNHDQNNHPHRSALVLLDGTPRMAHMGNLSWFNLRQDGIAYICADWQPGMSTDHWLVWLGTCLDSAFVDHRKVVVFGHVDLADRSHSDSGAWPRPSVKQLEVLADGRDVHWFLGHIHEAESWGVTTKRPGKVQIVGALRRLRWDEAGNPDGFVLFDTETGNTTRIPLDGPRYIDLTAGEELPEVSRPGDVVRAGAAEQRVTEYVSSAFGTALDLVTPPREREKANTSSIILKPGGSLEDHMVSWYQQQEGITPTLSECLAEVRALLPEGCARGVGMGVSCVLWVVSCMCVLCGCECLCVCLRV